MSKSEWARKALSELGWNSKPKVVSNYLIQKYSINVSPMHVSQEKSRHKRQQSLQPTVTIDTLRKIKFLISEVGGIEVVEAALYLLRE